jgi:hypothetical protein
MQNPSISFSVCNKAVGSIARIFHSQKEPKRIANQVTELIGAKHEWNIRPTVQLTLTSDTVRYRR